MLVGTSGATEHREPARLLNGLIPKATQTEVELREQLPKKRSWNRFVTCTAGKPQRSDHVVSCGYVRALPGISNVRRIQVAYILIAEAAKLWAGPSINCGLGRRLIE